jgi:hypothetical protein
MVSKKDIEYVKKEAINGNKNALCFLNDYIMDNKRKPLPIHDIITEAVNGNENAFYILGNSIEAGYHLSQLDKFLLIYEANNHAKEGNKGASFFINKYEEILLS